jgi:putative NIF3 family GTP cyclohydrolase 1 type 2
MATGDDKMAGMNRTRNLSVVLSGASLALGFSLYTAPAFAQAPTAAEAWLRIEHRYAEAPPTDTVDTLKGGDPSTPVTGIATTFLDTMEVLREAVKRGDNLIISHEPTFYNHRDETKDFVNDPVYKEKMAYIVEHHLAVYRLHDQIHADPKGDHILEGVYKAFGWEKLPHPAFPHGEYFVTIPATTLGELAKSLKERFHAETLRVEGDPSLSITHVALIPGAAGLKEQVTALNAPEVELLIAGEASEWETVEYVRDAVAQGRHKAMILLGHEVSEEPGMEQCAIELRELFPGMRVDHIVAGQPMWNPDHPPMAKAK